MSTTTANAIITEAFCDLGVIRVGETLSAGILADGLVRLNQRISAHSIEQLMATTQTHGIYSLVNGVSRYTFGVGGTFNTAARPEKVTGWVSSYGNFCTGGKILTFEELQQLSENHLGSSATIPQAVGADMAFPLINIGVFPIPGQNPGNLELSYWTALTQFADGTTSYTFPDGWLDFLHFDLAMALMPRYGRQSFDPTVLAANAQSSKAKIADLNRSTQAPQQGS